MCQDGFGMIKTQAMKNKIALRQQKVRGVGHENSI